MHERRFHPSQIHKLEDPERTNWLPAQEIVDSLGLQPGWTVADIGAGSGYFTVPIAKMIGAAGRVFAVDVSPEMLDYLRAKLSAASVANVECIESDAVSTGLASGCCDCVFLANVWHEFDDPKAIAAEMRRIVKPGGRVGVLDWRPDADPVHGPPLEHRIQAEDARRLFTEAGFLMDAHVQLFPFSWFLRGALPSDTTPGRGER